MKREAAFVVRCLSDECLQISKLGWFLLKDGGKSQEV